MTDRKTNIKPQKKTAQPAEESKPQNSSKKKKLSYKLQRELDQMPERIQSCETQLEEIQKQVDGAEFYQQEQSRVQEVLLKMTQIQEELDQLCERWVELESMQEPD